MSTFEHAFIRTELNLEDLAARLSTILGMRMSQDDSGRVFLSRPAAEGKPGEVGGEIQTNRYAYPFDEPEEESVIDGYDIVWDLGYTGRDDDAQDAEARSLFAEMTTKAPWPAVLLHGLDLLVAAWNPELGIRWFPPGTSPDAKDRALWEPYRRARRT